MFLHGLLQHPQVVMECPPVCQIPCQDYVPVSGSKNLGQQNVPREHQFRLHHVYPSTSENYTD